MIVLSGPFRGARISMDWRHSKRKILGVYEHELNPWLERILKEITVLVDIGANDGYFTLGCSHRLKNKEGALILAIEPQKMELEKIKSQTSFDRYRSIQYEFYDQCIGSAATADTMTFSNLMSLHPKIKNSPSLIKMDIEGAEEDVIRGAGVMQLSFHHWLVETHGERPHRAVMDFFQSIDRKVEVIESCPHWLLGPEARSIKTRWVVTVPES